MNKTTFSLNDTIPFGYDEIYNSLDKVKDWQVILKYDLALLDSTDSDENKSYSANENNEYTEPTGYDSAPDIGVSYNSIDEHVYYYNTTNDDEHIERHLFEKLDRNETFYESPEKREWEKDIRRERVILGSASYSFKLFPQ